jgi:membrane protease subunit (stomatin/prohibitin family)
MALFEKIMAEFIDIIEWNDDSADTILWRFPRFQDEIKNGAKLTVRPSQVAVFVNEGKVADIFPPGMHTLSTQNLPVLSTLKGWKFGFDSPFKAEVYFLSTRQFTDLKWGTKNPVMMRDQDFGMVRLRAFGSYVIKVDDPKKVVEQVAGTNPVFSVEDVREQLRNIVTSRFADMLGSAKIPALDLAARYDELSAQLSKLIAAEFSQLGFATTQVLVENISLPEEVEKAIDKRSSMGAVGNLDQFTKFQAANALEAAAKNPGGGASAGLGLGVGMGMAGQLGAIGAAATAPTTSSTPPPLNAGGPPPLPQKEWWVAVSGQQNGPHDLSGLASLMVQGAINRETLAWKQGFSGWMPMTAVPELKSLFG